MKINDDLKVALEQLGQTDALEKKDKTKAQAFEAILAKELEEAQGVAPEAGKNITVKGVLPEMLSQQLEKSGGLDNPLTQPQLEELATHIDSLFSQMDTYSQLLGTPENADMRELYASLESMTDGVKNLKEGYPNMEQQDPLMASMVNELDVLTTTELFKFNRGDYF